MALAPTSAIPVVTVERTAMCMFTPVKALTWTRQTLTEQMLRIGCIHGSAYVSVNTEGYRAIAVVHRIAGGRMNSSLPQTGSDLDIILGPQVIGSRLELVIGVDLIN
ncbi:hypothetical protein [Mycobacterium sp. RTGN5]|uniref:hypothetical protein n=1 Tax=Mycobacterium sp. RTGN5 TaxID=3016522 RepID=UPI0029C6C84C|nr:hypothetical protein [Mycobacterium sp. RTGN5]